MPPTRRFSVIVPSGKETKDESEVLLSQVMVDQTGLTVFKVPTEEVVEKIPFELIQGWWLNNMEEMTVVVTDDTKSAPKGSIDIDKGAQGGVYMTREIKLKSKRAQDIVDCMQDVVTNILQGKNSSDATASNGSGQKHDSRQGEGAGAVSSSETKAKKGESSRNGYVYLKSGFLQKRREKFPYRWKERYFILERQSSGKHTIQYFEDKESSKDTAKELGAIDLSTITNLVRYTDGPFLSFMAFQMNKTRERRFLLKAPTLRVRNEWADAIESII